MSETSRKIRVLLVEDDEKDYVFIKNLFDDFRDRCYQLDWIDDGKKALESMKNSEYDVYLIDHRLGEYDGLEILRTIIAGGCTSPIILLTGHNDEQVDNEAMIAGAADYLVKNSLEAFLLEKVIRYSLQHARVLEKMQASEEKFRSVIQSASDAIFLINENGKVILWNKAAEYIYGYPEEEIIGQCSTKLLGEKYARKAMEVGVREMIKKILTPIPGKVTEGIGKRKDASEFPLEIKGSVWKTNEGTFYTVIIRDMTAHVKIRESLRRSKERYHDLFENARDIIYVHDLEGNFLSANRSGEETFGFSRTEPTNLHMRDFISAEDLKNARVQIAAAIEGKPSTSYEMECVNKEGRKISFEVSSRIIYRDDKPYAVQGIARDITDRKLAEEERDRLYSLSNDLLATIGFDGELLHINPAWEKILGYKKSELIGRSLYEITHPNDRSFNLLDNEDLHKGKAISDESRLIRKDGSHCWILWSSTPVASEKILYVVGRNITERKKTEEILHRNARYDALTDLPNRAHFMDHLRSAIERFEGDSESAFAVLFIDLDRFKIINDGLGHLIGDKLLIAIAERIKASLRPGDVVARLGGDEFTILIHNVKQTNDAILVAERIQKQLLRPFRLDSYEVFSSASIGIIVSDDTHRNPEDFLRDADSAMYRAKEAGKARYEIFDHEMHVRNMNLLQVENDLRRAIERREFRLYYQPIVDMKTGEIKELEALIRWHHPEFGIISPNEFINVAEETGLIISIGEWVLEEACRQTKYWQKSLMDARDLTISVNLSAKQLMHPSLTAQVINVLKKTDLDMEFLKLEVTESTVMENSETAMEVLNDLSAIGINFSTDDFGTGYSSLSYLHQFPFKRIKIDRGFVGKIDTDVKSESIVQTILMLGNNLGLEVVAEGIENETQMRKLTSAGCRFGQGFLFSKPLSAEQTKKLLEEKLKADIFRQNLNLSYKSLKPNEIVELKNSQ